MQVRNQRMLDTLYHTLYADEIKMMEEAEQEDALYHHGVLGMSWGDKNGPPYPLGGINKKVARVEYKAKKEKERRLKKLQRAAKKARKEKKRQEEKEADILKKKQKLVKEGDLDKIRKNADLFTNEELQYVIERDTQKRALGSRDERSADEKFELAMKRMAQIGDIAANAGKVLSAAKIGADILTSVKTAKVKDLEMEDKRLSAIKTEWEMRFKGREDTPESRQFINDAVNNQQYKPSKAEKKVDKAANKKRIEELKESPLDKKERELYEKARKEDLRNANKQLNQQIKDRKKSERDEFFGKFKKDKDGSDDKQKKTDKSVRDFAKGLDVDEAWQKVKKDAAAQQETKRQFTELNNGWESKPYKDTVKTSYTTDGSNWAESFLSSGKSWDTYTTQKGWQVTPRKKEVTANKAEAGNVSGRNTEPAPKPAYSPSGRSSWSSKPLSQVASSGESKPGREYVLSSRSSWGSKPVSSISETTSEPKNNALVEAEKRASAIRESMRQNEQHHEVFKSQLKAMQDYHKEEQKREEKIRAGAQIGGFKAQQNYYDKVLTWLRDTGGLKTMSSTEFDQLSKASKDIGKRETERLLKEWWDAPNHLS